MTGIRVVAMRTLSDSLLRIVPVHSRVTEVFRRGARSEVGFARSRNAPRRRLLFRNTRALDHGGPFFDVGCEMRVQLLRAAGRGLDAELGVALLEFRNR